jgi:hypothetical protein
MAPANILTRDELKGDTEGLKVAGICRKLGFGECDVEREAGAPGRPTALSRLRLVSRRRGLRQASVGRKPVSKGPRRETEGVTELFLGDALFSRKAAEGADHQGTDSRAAKLDVLQDGGSDGEERPGPDKFPLKERTTVVSRRAAPAHETSHGAFKAGKRARNQATDALGRDPLPVGSPLDIKGNPVPAQPVDDAEADESEKSAWLSDGRRERIHWGRSP